MAAPIGDVRVQYLRVTNGTDKPWSDRHDGVPVTLAPGQSQNIPLDMAAHFFGWHQHIDQATMLRHMARRQGWNAGDYIVQDPEVQRRLAAEFFETFQIEPVTYKLVEEKAPPARAAAGDEPVPALTDEELEQSIREPTDVKELARSGLKDPDAEGPQGPGRGHPRRDTHGRRRE
jgi:hypothetical protein